MICYRSKFLAIVSSSLCTRSTFVWISLIDVLSALSVLSQHKSDMAHGKNMQKVRVSPVACLPVSSQVQKSCARRIGCEARRPRPATPSAPGPGPSKRSDPVARIWRALYLVMSPSPRQCCMYNTLLAYNTLQYVAIFKKDQESDDQDRIDWWESRRS